MPYLPQSKMKFSGQGAGAVQLLHEWHLCRFSCCAQCFPACTCLQWTAACAGDARCLASCGPAKRATAAQTLGAARADLPAPGTNDVYRVCTPFPFEANLTLAAAQRDMELHLDNFEAFVYFSPGVPRLGRLPPLHSSQIAQSSMKWSSV